MSVKNLFYRKNPIGHFKEYSHQPKNPIVGPRQLSGGGESCSVGFSPKSDRHKSESNKHTKQTHTGVTKFRSLPFYSRHQSPGETRRRSLLFRREIGVDLVIFVLRLYDYVA